MVSLKLQRRLAAGILNCGTRKLWLDPNETTTLCLANSRMSIRKLVKNGFIFKRLQKIHTRSRAQQLLEAKRKGRHSGYGKRKGTSEARESTKVLWMRRVRVLRSLLRKYRESEKIDKHMYRKFYMKVKGGVFRNRRVLMERIHKIKSEKGKEKTCFDQLKAKKGQRKDIVKRKLSLSQMVT